MELSIEKIQKVIDELFDVAVLQLNEKIINAFIPFGGITEIPSDQFQTLAFDDELAELVDYLREYSVLLNQFISNPKQKTRLLAQMYCRVMENDYQYLIIYNVLLLLNNSNPDWEFKTIRNGKPFYCENPTSKIDEICSLCKSNKLEIGTVLKNILKADLRNSYYHSQYTISPDGSFVNTRFYSPTSQIKPAKKVYKPNEIESLYIFAESFFDNFFKRFFAERKKFKDGKEYKLFDRKKISWEVNSHRWLVYNK
ncbi:MAG: hypothetical protein IT277_04470 [Ignavibacteriaceae bacterium]|jgi:hypothetical protein|nr:hypothetical protein [Ignavibacteriaceae bacterium]